MNSINLLAFYWLFVFVVGIPHPIQEADNNTKCEFSLLPTGYLSVGKTVSVPGECMQVTCQEDLTISGLTCPTHFVYRGCELTPIDYYKTYPDCCPQVLCKYTEFPDANEANQDYDNYDAPNFPHS